MFRRRLSPVERLLFWAGTAAAVLIFIGWPEIVAAWEWMLETAGDALVALGQRLGGDNGSGGAGAGGVLV